MKTVVHITHEAVQKIGGIGAVLHGLLTSRTYRAGVGRDILLGPLFTTDGPAEHRLGDGNTRILYSGLDAIRATPFAPDLARIEDAFGVRLVYGRKCFHDPLTGITSEPEVLLVDVRHYHPEKMAILKFVLFQDYGIDSARYEHTWDFEQYCRIAEPGLEALRAIGACTNGGGEQCTPILLSHEYMGMPTVLAARSRFPGQFRTVFYAHEVATVRRLVEEHPGHDTMFHNVLSQARAEGRYVEDVFGSQAGFYKHPLVQAACHCDNIFAVGDEVVKELRFLHPAFEEVRIDLAYNGVPARSLSLEEKSRSRSKLQRYAAALLGFRPDFVLTHLTRLVPSKGLWRDLGVVEHVEKHLARENKTAVLFIVSTETAARAPHDVLEMERRYKWPAAHREGHPDLSGGEAVFYAGVQEWNARARHCKVLFINQFVVDAASLGARAPADLGFLDFRIGSDAELGQSIYEPFGIAQVEPISFGGICLFSSLCGCAGFVRTAHKAVNGGNDGSPNVIEVDYTRLPDSLRFYTIAELLDMDHGTREGVESAIAACAAETLYCRLPRNPQQAEALLSSGAQLAAAMSWDVVAQHFILPGLDRAMAGSGQKVLAKTHPKP